MPTNQQVFDAALWGIRMQGYKRSLRSRKSYNFSGGDGTHCAYRGDNGLKCGVGHAVPDELYLLGDGLTMDTVASIKGAGTETAIGSLLDRFPKIAEYFKGVSSSLLIDLQSAHDSDLANGPDAWEEQMRYLAGEYGLNYIPPAEMPTQLDQGAQT